MSSVPTGSANLADVKCTNIDCARLMRLKKHFLTEEAESKCYIIFTFFSFLNVKELFIGLGLKLWWKNPSQVNFAAPTLPLIRYGYVSMNDIYSRPNLEITVRFEEIATRVEKDEVTCQCAQYVITGGNNQLVVQ